MKRKVSYYIFIIITLVCYICLIDQLRENVDLHNKRMIRVESALMGKKGHPLLIFSHEFEPFVKAYSYIQASDAARFWIISDYLDPSILLNYYVYPKEVWMRAETQDFLNLKYLNRSDEPIIHPPLKSQYPILYINLEEMKVMDSWNGSP